MRSLVICFALLAGPGALGLASAQTTSNNDLENCVFSNGAPIPPRACETLRANAEKRRIDAEDLKASREQRQRRDEERRLKMEQEQQERDALVAKAREDLAARKAAREEAMRQQQAKDAAAAKVAAAKESARKEACGADYKNMRVGMTIGRAQECVATLKLTGQINRPDALVSTYEGSGVYAHVIDGKVVAWGH